MFGYEDFEKLKPHAHRIADTQRAWLHHHSRPEQPLNGPTEIQPNWTDQAALEAQAWAADCTRYITGELTSLDGNSWTTSMVFADDWLLVCSQHHNRPNNLTERVIYGARLRACLDPYTGDPAIGKPLKHGGCDGMFQPSSQRCDSCGAHYVLRARRERCNVCDALLEQNQWDLGLCRTHRLQAARTAPAGETCMGHPRHIPIGTEGDTRAICNRCKRQVTFTDGQWATADSVTPA